MMSERCPAGRRWVKIDLHIHSSEDPCDELDYNAFDLLERAHQKGFEVLSITLHREVLWSEDLFRRARELGILLIPGTELLIENRDVLLLNVTPAEARSVKSFDDLRALRAKRADTMLVMAPHPYFIIGHSLGRRLEKEADCFDCVEYCHFHTWGINLNRRAERIAKKKNLPVVATSDAHQLRWFGSHYSMVEIEGEPSAESVLGAIRAGRIKRHSPALSPFRVLEALWFIKVEHPYRLWRSGRRSKLREARA